MTHTEPLTLSHPDCHSESHSHTHHARTEQPVEGGREGAAPDGQIPHKTEGQRKKKKHI